MTLFWSAVVVSVVRLAQRWLFLVGSSLSFVLRRSFVHALHLGSCVSLCSLGSFCVSACFPAGLQLLGPFALCFSLALALVFVPCAPLSPLGFVSHWLFGLRLGSSLPCQVPKFCCCALQWPLWWRSFFRGFLHAWCVLFGPCSGSVF